MVKYIGAGLLLGGISGLATGTVVTLYKFCAKQIIHLSEQGYHHLREQPLWLIPTAIALFVLATALAALYRRTHNLRGGGIPTAIGALRGWVPLRWVMNAIGVFTLSLTTFLVGVPLGNEGPSVQLGTAMGKGCSGLMGRYKKAWQRYGMTGGACAGFSTATGAPLSGILFAVEEAHQRVSPLILLIATAAVSTARLVSDLLAPVLGVSSTLFPDLQLRTLEITDCWIPLTLGVVCGLFAVLFLSFYRGMSQLMNKKLNKVADAHKIFAVMLLTMGMGFCSFSYISTGHELMLALFDGEGMWLLVALLLARTLLTVSANVAGMTGGIFLPLLAIGGTLSALFAGCAQTLLGLDATYYPVIMVLGITACIAGMMKMPLTAVAFAIEALSAHHNILPVLLVTVVAYGVTELFEAVSINDRVLDNRVEEIHKGKKPVGDKVTLTVKPGTFAEGKEIRDLFWPEGLVVLSTEQPHGGKALQSGDVLHVQYTTYSAKDLYAEVVATLGEQV